MWEHVMSVESPNERVRIDKKTGLEAEGKWETEGWQLLLYLNTGAIVFASRCFGLDWWTRCHACWLECLPRLEDVLEVLGVIVCVHSNARAPESQTPIYFMSFY